MINAVEILVGKHEGNRLTRRPRTRSEDNIKAEEIGFDAVHWIQLVQFRVH
jgi:hypothetical protein